MSTHDAGHDLNRIAAYLEGRLSLGEQAEVSAHLASCVECRGTVAALARAAAAAAAAADLPGLDAPALDRRMWQRGPAVWLTAAAAVLVILAGIALFRVPGAGPADRPDSMASAGEVRRDVPLPDPAVAEPGPPARVERRPPPAAPAAPVDEGLLARRGAERVVNDKTFRLVAGEWIDGEYDPLDFLPVVSVATPAQRAELLAARPALVPYAALGDRVLVVLDGRVYRFE